MHSRQEEWEGRALREACRGVGDCGKTSSHTYITVFSGSICHSVIHSTVLGIQSSVTSILALKESPISLESAEITVITTDCFPHLSSGCECACVRVHVHILTQALFGPFPSHNHFSTHTFPGLSVSVCSFITSAFSQVSI